MKYSIKSIEITIDGEEGETCTVEDIYNLAVDIIGREGIGESKIWAITQVLKSSIFFNNGFIELENGVIKFITEMYKTDETPVIVFYKDEKCLKNLTTIRIIKK